MTDSNKLERDGYAYPGKRIAENGTPLGHGQGMSMRDYFAGQALIGWISSCDHDSYLCPKQYSELSYEFADAMIAERNKAVQS